MAPRSYRSPVRERRSQDTRRAILDAAAALFAERGCARTTLTAVASAAGVAPNTVYASVGDGDALVRAVVRESPEALLERLDDLDPAQILEAVATCAGDLWRARKWGAGEIAAAERRELLRRVAVALAAREGIRPGTGPLQAEHALVLHLGSGAWQSLSDEGLDVAASATWLTARLTETLLG